MQRHIVIFLLLFGMLGVSQGEAMWTHGSDLDEPAAKRRAVGEAGVPVSTAAFLQSQLLQGGREGGSQDPFSDAFNPFASWSAIERETFNRVIATHMQEELEADGLYGPLEKEIVQLLWASQPFVSPVFQASQICWQSVRAHFSMPSLRRIPQPVQDKVGYFFKEIFDLAAQQIGQLLSPSDGLRLLTQYKHTPLPIVRPISWTPWTRSNGDSGSSSSIAESLFPEAFDEPSA